MLINTVIWGCIYYLIRASFSAGKLPYIMGSAIVFNILYTLLVTLAFIEKDDDTYTHAAEDRKDRKEYKASTPFLLQQYIEGAAIMGGVAYVAKQAV